MKKLLLSSVVVLALMATSCKKDRTCTCTVAGNGLSTSASTTIKDTKKKAEEACEKGTTAAVAGFTTTCVLD